jgi:hypothetical protein
MLAGSGLMDSSIRRFKEISSSRLRGEKVFSARSVTSAAQAGAENKHFADFLLASIRERSEPWRGIIPPCPPPIPILR